MQLFCNWLAYIKKNMQSEIIPLGMNRMVYFFWTGRYKDLNTDRYIPGGTPSWKIELPPRGKLNQKIPLVENRVVENKKPPDGKQREFFLVVVVEN